MPRGASWSEEELEILKKNYNSLSVKELLRLLPNRTEASIINKAKKMKLSSRQNLKWTQEEEVKLKELFPINTIEELLNHFPNRTSNSILGKAKELALKKDDSHIKKIRRKRTGNWTEFEDSILKKYYPYGGYKPVNKRLPHRNAKSILSRAVKLGIKRIDRYDHNWDREVISETGEGENRRVEVHFTKPTNDEMGSSKEKKITMIFNRKPSEDAIGNFVSVLNELYDKAKLKEIENKRLANENDKSE